MTSKLRLVSGKYMVGNKLRDPLLVILDMELNMLKMKLL
jgi:hypothetical protein